ncbi:hypothetical protein ACFLXE_05270 [Chloroflexota bacterium]
MTTLTETITQELLAAVGDPGGLDAVLQEHSRSKGPLYHALALATSELQQQLDEMAVAWTEKASREKVLTQQIQEMETRYQEMEANHQSLEQQISQSEAKLAEMNDLRDRANALAGLGFGSDELSRLYGLLAEIAASQGALPEEGVAQFFQTVERYEQVVSLDLETKRAESKAAQAKAEMERWQAQAKHKESQSKVRIATIELVDKWLSQGIKEKDLPKWASILQKANVQVDVLAKELEKYGSLETLCNQRGQQAEKLNQQVESTQDRLNALKTEENKVRTAIVSIRDSALHEVEIMSNQTRQHLSILLTKAQEYGELEKQAAQLHDELIVARAFISREREDWVQVPPHIVQQLITGLIWWAGSGDNNRQVAAPSFICERIPAVRLAKVSLMELLVWMLSGILTEEQRKVMDNVG